MYDRVLLPISGATKVKLALDFLKDVLNPGGEITFLYVSTSVKFPGSAIEWRRAMNVVSDASAISTAAGLSSHYEVRNSSSVAAGILEEARSSEYDLIFFANPYYKRGQRRVFGSVIDEVVRKSHTETAVLSYVEGRPLKYDKTLLPTSGQRHALRAAKLTKALAKKSGGEVTVLYAGDQSQKAEAERILSEIKEIFESDNVKHFLVYRSGPVDAVILDEARKGYDLMMVGATEHPVYYQFLLGSIADKIVSNAPCHVLIVKTVNK
ncbi:universal stress protein UspA [Methanocella sp. CWC-04]|uniref:Universal stress protein UspA n=1 Tax=Methanooceanicella nereidis TaxID=2052831 RepID=A0AAP2RF32_9EURY|nr:universal stress protein [Methanocella sp. CWC-04]MCD1296153.1 universal stress protein UspA [Methanocella sp. CWC-04]